MLIPRRVKHRKQHRPKRSGNAKGGTAVAFGDFCLQATEGGYVTNRQIEAARIAMTRHIKRGGKVLVPFMYTEFVEMKGYLTSDQFLSGYAFQQALPGPTFSFTSFVGGMTLKNAGFNVYGQIIGSIIAVLGINLPGLILILFIVPFWNDLKKITRIKNSLSGINAVSVGFMGAAFLLLLQPVGINYLSIGLIIMTFLLLVFTKIKTPLLILAGILLGLFI